jgi:hypothetical protein
MKKMLKFPRRTIGTPLEYPRRRHIGADSPFVTDAVTPFGILRILEVKDGCGVLTSTEPDPSRPHTSVPPRRIRLKGKYRA